MTSAFVLATNLMHQRFKSEISSVSYCKIIFVENALGTIFILWKVSLYSLTEKIYSYRQNVVYNITHETNDISMYRSGNLYIKEHMFLLYNVQHYMYIY